MSLGDSIRQTASIASCVSVPSIANHHTILVSKQVTVDSRKPAANTDGGCSQFALFRESHIYAYTSIVYEQEIPSVAMHVQQRTPDLASNDSALRGRAPLAWFTRYSVHNPADTFASG